MSPETKKILAEFGWYEGRRVPEAILTKWIDTLAQVGLPPFDAAIKVLTEFGGLHIWPHRRPNSQFMVGHIHFDPLVAGLGEEDRVEGWVEFLNQRTYPIGEADYIMLLVAEDGKIYWDGQSMGGFGEGTIVGDNIYEAMNALLLRDKVLVKTAPFWPESAF